MGKMFWFHILYYVVTVVTVVILHCYNNFIDNKRILVKDTCRFNYYYLHLHDYVYCEDTCYYFQDESDDCPTIGPLVFAMAVIFVMIYCMLPGRKIDIYFFHYIVQMGFWYCAFKYDYQTLTIQKVLVEKGVYLGFVVPILHILYEKRLCEFLDRSDIVFLYFFIPFWVFGINLDSLNKVMGFQLSLTSEFKSNPVTLTLFVVLTVFLVIHQIFFIILKGTFIKSMIYIAVVALLMTPFLAIGMNIHVHHYLFALFTFPLITGPKDDMVTIVLYGTMVGAFVNGVVVWGPDPLFN